ncbi:MAG: hypothetical protein P8O79_12700 [Halieaceae bacterium]|nr:hypothetical protein [Halieaceae bacterium]
MSRKGLVLPLESISNHALSGVPPERQNKVEQGFQHVKPKGNIGPAQAKQVHG